MEKFKRLMHIPHAIQLEIAKCNQCGKCLSVCPTYNVTLDECDAARGLLQLVRKVYSGELPISDSYMTHLFNCILCRACTEVCPGNVAINDVIDWVKEQVVSQLKMSKIFHLSNETLTDNDRWKKYLSDHVANENKGAGWLTSISEDNGKKRTKQQVGFFVGCLMDIKYQNTAQSIMDWLKQYQFEVIVPREQVCCGMPALTIGDTDTAKSLIQKNINIFRNAGIKTVVTGCAHCAFMMKKKWGKVPFETYHIMELIPATYLTKTNRAQNKIRVGYQSACLLHRGLGVNNIIMQRILPNNLALSGAIDCCGQAGMSGFLFPHLTKSITDRQMRNYAHTDLGLLLTNCPWCTLSFDKQKNKQFETMSVTEYMIRNR